MIPSPGRDHRLTARVAPGINLGEPTVANIRPKPRIAWHRRPLFSPGLDGDHLVENLEGPGGEEWTFRESCHSQSVSFQSKYRYSRSIPDFFDSQVKCKIHEKNEILELLYLLHPASVS